MYLKKAVLPESLTELGSFAFSCNVYMDYAEIGGNVKEISENAFAWCSDLSTVKMHEGIEIIGESAFFNTGINSIEIPDSVTFIDKGKILLSGFKDDILNSHGVIKCSKSDFNEIEKSDFISARVTDFGAEVLISDRKKALQKYSGAIIDPTTLEEIMLFYVNQNKMEWR